jgi:hypothetical protein
MNVDNLEALAEALGVNSRWLIFGDAPKVPDDKLVYIWDRINDQRRQQALKILETFADDDQSQSA